MVAILQILATLETFFNFPLQLFCSFRGYGPIERLASLSRMSARDQFRANGGVSSGKLHLIDPSRPLALILLLPQSARHNVYVG